jgi:hypothetical protein
MNFKNSLKYKITNKNKDISQKNGGAENRTPPFLFFYSTLPPLPGGN